MVKYRMKHQIGIITSIFNENDADKSQAMVDMLKTIKQNTRPCILGAK